MSGLRAPPGSGSGGSRSSSRGRMGQTTAATVGRAMVGAKRGELPLRRAGNPNDRLEELLGTAVGRMPNIASFVVGSCVWNFIPLNAGHSRNQPLEGHAKQTQVERLLCHSDHEPWARL